MKTQVCAGLLFLSNLAFGTTIIVPGTSDPWLAGMPGGTTASIYDSAPGQSPVLVAGVPVAVGTVYSFQVLGEVSNDPTLPLCGPDGRSVNVQDGFTTHWVDWFVNGPQNGIGDITAPYNSLIGVFLGPDQPNLNQIPGALDYSTEASLDYLTVCPELQQPFFIGDGLTSGGEVQQIIAPAGATRLFLGTMDSYEWGNNVGSFAVAVSVPEPSVTSLALTLLLSGAFRGIQRRQWMRLATAP